MPQGSWWNGIHSWSWSIPSPPGFPTWLPSAITRGTDFLCIITHFLRCSWSMISGNTLILKFSPINLPQIIQISVNLYGHALSEILKNCVLLRESTCWWCFEIILPLQRGHVPSPSRMILLLCMWLIISVDISYQSSKKVDTPYSSKPLRSSIVTYPRELCSTTRILTCWWRFEIIPTVLTSGVSTNFSNWTVSHILAEIFLTQDLYILQKTPEEKSVCHMRHTSQCPHLQQTNPGTPSLQGRCISPSYPPSTIGQVAVSRYLSIHFQINKIGLPSFLLSWRALPRLFLRICYKL